MGIGGLDESGGPTNGNNSIHLSKFDIHFNTPNSSIQDIRALFSSGKINKEVFSVFSSSYSSSMYRSSNSDVFFCEVSNDEEVIVRGLEGVQLSFRNKDMGNLSKMNVEISYDEDSFIHRLYIDSILDFLKREWGEFHYEGGAFGDNDPITNGPNGCESGLCEIVSGIKGNLLSMQPKMDMYTQVLKHIAGDNFVELDRIDISMFDSSLSTNVGILRSLFGEYMKDDSEATEKKQVYDRKKLEIMYSIIGKTYEFSIDSIHVYIKHLDNLLKGIDTSLSVDSILFSGKDFILYGGGGVGNITERVIEKLESRKEDLEETLDRIKQFIDIENQKQKNLSQLIENGISLRAVVDDIEGELSLFPKIASRINLLPTIIGTSKKVKKLLSKTKQTEESFLEDLVLFKLGRNEGFNIKKGLLSIKSEFPKLDVSYLLEYIEKEFLADKPDSLYRMRVVLHLHKIIPGLHIKDILIDKRDLEHEKLEEEPITIYLTF